MLSHWAGSSPIAAAVQSLFRAGEPGAVFIAQKPSDLLVRRNKLTYSQDFTNAVWSKANATLAFTGATLAPDGTPTASKMTEAAINAGHSLTSANIAVRIGAPVTVSIYAKAAERSQIELQYFDGSANAFPLFDLTTGALLSANGADATTSTSIGNGWWRFTVTKTALAATGNLYAYPCVGGTNGYNGDGTSGIYLWGAQMDVNSSTASTYQPVTDWTTEYLAAVGNLVTQYTDNLGATPVLNLEDTVGLHLDTRPILLGPELVPGSNGSSVATWVRGFQSVDGTFAAPGNVFTHTKGATDGFAPRWVIPIAGLTIGRTYRVITGAWGGTAADRRLEWTATSDGTGAGSEFLVAPTTGSVVTATATTMYLALVTVGASAGQTQTVSGGISLREVIAAPNTVGQPLRSAELTTSGTFASSAGWTLTGTASISGGKLNIGATGGGVATATNNPLVTGATYEVVYTIDSLVGTMSVGCSATDPGTGRSAAGTYREVIRNSVAGAITVFGRGGGITSAVISSISFKLLYGNHRSQSSAPARARLSARYNKVTARSANPVDLTNVTKGGDAASVLSVVSDTAALAAAGLSSVCTLGNVYKLDNSAGVAEAFAAFAGGTGNLNSHQAQVYWRGTGNAALHLTFVVTGATTALPAGYQKVSTTAVAANVAAGVAVFAQAGAVVYFILSDLRESCYSYLPSPQVVWDATTGYDDTGFPARLVYSGAQGYATGSVDFSGSSQAQTFSGLSTISQAATGMAIELGPIATATAGSFAVVPAITSGYDFLVRGDGASYMGEHGVAAVPPLTQVWSCQFDLLGTLAVDKVKPRVNGATPSLIDTSGGAAGVGALRADVLNFGSRNNGGTAAGTLNMTADEFISIVRGGATPDANTISYVERFCARYPALTF